MLRVPTSAGARELVGAGILAALGAAGLCLATLLLLLAVSPSRIDAAVQRSFASGALTVHEETGSRWAGRRARRDCEMAFSAMDRGDLASQLFAPRAPRDRDRLASPCEMTRDLASHDPSVNYDTRRANPNAALARLYVIVTSLPGLPWAPQGLAVAAALGLGVIALRRRPGAPARTLASAWVSAAAVAAVLASSATSLSLAAGAVVLAGGLAAIPFSVERPLRLILLAGVLGAALVLSDYRSGLAVAGLALAGAAVLVNTDAWPMRRQFLVGILSGMVVALAAAWGGEILARDFNPAEALLFVSRMAADWGGLLRVGDDAPFEARLARLLGADAWGQGALAAAAVVFVIASGLAWSVVHPRTPEAQRQGLAAVFIVAVIAVWGALNFGRIVAAPYDYLLVGLALLIAASLAVGAALAATRAAAASPSLAVGDA